MEEHPRTRIEQLIREDGSAELLDLAAGIHGHYCPGLALGILAASHAMRSLDGRADGLEDLVAITETNNCFSDGIQVVTGCTFGNNGLVFLDLGKTAFTLALRNGKALRYSARPEAREKTRQRYAEYSDRYQEVVAQRRRDPELLREYFRLGRLRALAVLEFRAEDLFTIQEAKPRLPEYAPSLPSLTCPQCGEEFMQGRAASDGHTCLACSGEEIFTLEGSGIQNRRSWEL